MAFPLGLRTGRMKGIGDSPVATIGIAMHRIAPVSLRLVCAAFVATWGIALVRGAAAPPEVEEDAAAPERVAVVVRGDEGERALEGTVVIEAADGDAAAFLESTGLAAAHLVQSDGSLAAEWGVTKAGCVALVRPDGTVEAVWPGISRQGFRDLAGRLGDVNLLHPDSLALLPGAATAGCPL